MAWCFSDSYFWFKLENMLKMLQIFMLLIMLLKNTTTTTSVLMSLSWLAGVDTFCFNLVSPFFLIRCILSSQAILFQIFLYTFFPQFPWLTLCPSYFKSHNLTYLGVDVSTDDMTIGRQLWIIISSIFTTTPTLSQRTSVDTLSTTLILHIILIIQCSAPSKLALYATVSSHVLQQYSKAGLAQHW